MTPDGPTGLRIAFAGHRAGMDAPGLGAALDAAFVMAIDAAGPEMAGEAWLNTGVALGADTLAISVWRGGAFGKIHAFLPYPHPDESLTGAGATDDPRSPASAEDVLVTDLADRFEAWTVLDGQDLQARRPPIDPHREQARRLMAGADLVVVVWNGLPAAGPGGTGDTVRQAQDLGLPVLWIGAAPPHALSLLEAGPPNASQIAAVPVDVQILRRRLLARQGRSTPSPSRTPTVREPQYRWLLWGPPLLLLLGAGVVKGFLPLPLPPLVVALAVLLILNVVRWFPRTAAGRRKLPWLLLILLPWLAALLFGPLGLTPIEPPHRQAMLMLQNALMIGSLLTPFALLPVTGGARAATLAFGALNLLPSALVWLASTVILSPGS